MNDIQDQQKIVEAEIKRLEEMGGSFTWQFQELRDSAFARFPLIFIFLPTFGVAATIYGFEKLIDRLPYFQDNPLLVLTTGIVILIFTGSLFKKLT